MSTARICISNLFDECAVCFMTEWLEEGVEAAPTFSLCTSDPNAFDGDFFSLVLFCVICISICVRRN